MNENTNNEQNAGANSDLAKEAASDLSTRLSPYKQWQQDNAAELMDGTSSTASYIRLISRDGIEYGLQPRFSPCGDHLHIAGRLRVAYAPEPVLSADEPLKDNEGVDAYGSKVNALLAFTGTSSDDWQSYDSVRVSRGFNLHIPLNAQSEGALEQLVGLFANGLFDKMVGKFPTPVGGWDLSQLRKARTIFTDYVRLTANQFAVFNVTVKTVSDNTWTLETPAGELNETLVGFLAKFDAAPQEGEADTDTE